MNIVVTGASKGIGKAITQRYAQAKHNIFICARDEKQLAQTAREIEGNFAGCTVHYKQADLSKKEQVLHFAAWILEKAPAVDVLVNNAGTFIPGSVYNEVEGTLEAMIEGNLYSAYHLTRALLPAMMKNKSGHIFNMCSIASLQAYANGGSYSISKAALMSMSKNLREEMKPFGIKVTAVYPGAVYTQSWEGAGVEPSRLMEVADIAELVYSASGLSASACVEEIVVRPLLGDLP